MSFLLKNKTIIWFIVFMLLLIVNSIVIFRNPWYDWDMIIYTWIVKNIDNPNIQEVHLDTFREINDKLDDERYSILKQANHYRLEVYNNYETFKDQFPFYTIKYIYTYTIYSIHKITWLSVVNSIVITSILCYLLVWVLLYILFLPELRKTILFIFPLYLFMSFGQMIVWWRSTTPDMLWVLFLLIWVFLILRKNILLWLTILVISLWTRTDNIIFIVLLLWYLKFFASKEYKIWWMSFLWFGIARALFYKWINAYFENFWYQILFYHSFIDQIYHPAVDKVFLTPVEYFQVFKEKLRVLITLDSNRPESFFFVYILLWIITILIARLKWIWLKNIYVWLIVLSIVSLRVRFILFPNIQERYFIFSFLIIFISFIKLFFNDFINNTNKQKD